MLISAVSVKQRGGVNLVPVPYGLCSSLDSCLLRLQLIISVFVSCEQTTVSILHLLAWINEHVIQGIGSSTSSHTHIHAHCIRCSSILTRCKLNIGFFCVFLQLVAIKEAPFFFFTTSSPLANVNKSSEA